MQLHQSCQYACADAHPPGLLPALMLLGAAQEVLVDIEEDPGKEHHFRFVLSPGVTPASHLLLPRRLAGLSAADCARPATGLVQRRQQCMLWSVWLVCSNCHASEVPWLQLGKGY